MMSTLIALQLEGDFNSFVLRTVTITVNLTFKCRLTVESNGMFHAHAGNSKLRSGEALDRRAVVRESHTCAVGDTCTNWKKKRSHYNVLQCLGSCDHHRNHLTTSTFVTIETGKKGAGPSRYLYECQLRGSKPTLYRDEGVFLSFFPCLRIGFCRFLSRTCLSFSKRSRIRGSVLVRANDRQ
jgi:hypothetical protein